jgi:hypothetical protein
MENHDLGEESNQKKTTIDQADISKKKIPVEPEVEKDQEPGKKDESDGTNEWSVSWP